MGGKLDAVFILGVFGCLLGGFWDFGGGGLS